MNGNSVYIVHLVKFIYAYHPSVSQDHGSCFQLPVTCSSQHTPRYSVGSSTEVVENATGICFASIFVNVVYTSKVVKAIIYCVVV